LLSVAGQAPTRDESIDLVDQPLMLATYLHNTLELFIVVLLARLQGFADVYGVLQVYHPA
jgi:hypothetical protein